MTPAPVPPNEETLRATCRREHPHCFACSEPARGGLGLSFDVAADGAVAATWHPLPGCESFSGIIHGGLIATLLDAAMVHALFAREISARTADLRIRYRQAVRIDRPVTVTARLVNAFGPLYELEAQAGQDGRPCATARARFMRATPAALPTGETVPVLRPESVRFRPIGVIRSPHGCAERTPIQPVYATGCRGRVELWPEFAAGLADIAGFSHLYLIYHLHLAGPARLRVKPFLQDVEHGVFATRAPTRPNPIGLSLVRLLACEDSVLHIDGVDVLDGTPLLDLKPYAPRYDAVQNPLGGWTDDVNDATAQERGRRDYGAEPDATGLNPRPPNSV